MELEDDMLRLMANPLKLKQTKQGTAEDELYRSLCYHFKGLNFTRQKFENMVRDMRTELQIERDVRNCVTEIIDQISGDYVIPDLVDTETETETRHSRSLSESRTIQLDRDFM